MKRIPRPAGITHLAKQFSLTKDNNHYFELIDFSMKTYLYSNFNWNGCFIPLEQLAYNLGIPIQKAQESLNRILFDQAHQLRPDQIANYTQNLGNLALQMVLEDKAHAKQQTSILELAQGDKYRPFISDTLIKSLDTSQKATKNFLDFTDKLSKFQDSRIQGPQNQEDSNKISQQEALDIIYNNRPQTNPKHIQKVLNLPSALSEEQTLNLPIKAELYDNVKQNLLEELNQDFQRDMEKENKGGKKPLITIMGGLTNSIKGLGNLEDPEVQERLYDKEDENGVLGLALSSGTASAQNFWDTGLATQPTGSAAAAKAVNLGQEAIRNLLVSPVGRDTEITIPQTNRPKKKHRVRRQEELGLDIETLP